MSESEKINRRDLIVKTAGAAGAAGALVGVAPALAQTLQPLPPGFDTQAAPVAANWDKQLNEVVNIDFQIDAPELDQEAVKERHRIYCYLLMKLIHRFWNGNKNGPFGTYPQRTKQIEFARQSPQVRRYRGDMIADPEGSRVNWDRYLGHNVACTAVDGNGAIIDFDFNHNNFFRSTAEHAESRLVRRLFSLTDFFDSWKTGQKIGNRSSAFSLNEVTLYTSLESCAQCSGIMSLAGVKQIIYMQNDFTAYMIGNIMYNLANRNPMLSPGGAPTTLPGAPVPIPASKVDLDEFEVLNEENIAFCNKLINADKSDPRQAFFVSEDGKFMDFSPSITSFLCTDRAYEIFEGAGNKLDTLTLRYPHSRFPDKGATDPDREKVLTNQQSLAEALRFYDYADIDGYRGSPHKL
jgi:tRNA(Arg) A34 adenosine deaminase TadA